MRLIIGICSLVLALHTQAFKDDAVDHAIKRYLWSGNEAILNFEMHIHLNTIAKRLESGYELFIIDGSDINAFATEYNMIGINKGLITSTQHEEELLSVIAHEIGHIELKHFARLRSNDNSGLLTLGGLMLAGITKNSELSQALVTSSIASSVQQNINWTRRFEIEADNFARDELKSHGINSNAMSDFFLRLQGNKDAIEYLQTHPLSTNRAADSYISETTTTHANSVEYEILKAMLNAQITADDTSQSVRIYMKAYELFTQRKFAQALDILDAQPLQGLGEYVVVLRTRILSALDNHTEAISLLSATSKDSTLSKYYLAQAYFDSDQPRIAASILKNHNYLSPNYYYYVLLERIYAHTKELDKYHSTVGDRLVFTGDITNARINYNLARSLTQNIDLRQKIDAKLSTL